MRTHGWGGTPPATDDEAAERILAGAITVLERRGRELTIADVAREVEVTRQTVYRYYASAGDLVVAVAVRSAGPLLDELVSELSGETDPATVLVHGLARVVHRLPEDPFLGPALWPGGEMTRAVSLTSALARDLGAQVLRNFDVDWEAAGLDEQTMGELVELALRLIQSFVLDSGEPRRTHDEHLAYFDRWVRPAVAQAATAAGAGPGVGPVDSRPT